MMDDLTAFVRARLDEDEAAAQASHYEGQHWLTEEEGVYRWPDDELVHSADRKADARHIARHDPARVLREVEAKRRIAARHRSTWNDYRDGDGIERASRECAECEPSGSPDDWPCETIRAVASVWSDHPDYRQEWACDGDLPQRPGGTSYPGCA